MSRKMTAEFQEKVWGHYRAHGRQMSWRDFPTFYNVLVSEIMLQQTQVDRVRVKFQEFMERFPTIQDLAAAPLADVLRVWQGLGYNRRAKYLHEAAKVVASDQAPAHMDELVQLPGVGKNTAAAIMNYVYMVPTAFVETNIRSVYFEHFFEGEVEVSDSLVLARVEETMDREHPREWFWALMDYGSWLKKQGSGRLTMSRHYKKQSPLKGSLREMRGLIIKALASGDSNMNDLRQNSPNDGRFAPALRGLEQEGLITIQNDTVYLTKS